MSKGRTRLLLLGLLTVLLVTTITARRVPAKPTHAKHQPEVSPWHSFNRLLGVRRGSHVAGVAKLKRYFVRFGYMSKPDRDPTDKFDGPMEAAVKLYQIRLGLQVTGQLDSVTVDRIMSPRCGISDDAYRNSGTLAPSLSGIFNRFKLSDSQFRWKRPHPIVLTYAVSPTDTIDYPPTKAVRDVIQRSFERWAQAIPVQFAEIEDYDEADIKVAFYAGEHGDGSAFDGPGGVLAHAAFPEYGLLHLDKAERWAVDLDADTSPNAFDLESLMTHEIGHTLGLDHSESPEAVMYPYFGERQKRADLSVDDVKGIQELYGANPNFKFSPPTKSAAVAKSPGKSSWLLGAVLVILVTLWPCGCRHATHALL